MRQVNAFYHNFRKIFDKYKTKLQIHIIEEQIKWYTVFGGIPKYYVIAEEQGLEGKDIFSALKILLFRDFAPLKEAAARKILEELNVKSKSVGWHQDNREEYFGLIAKKIENKEKLKANGYFAFDLTDFKL